MFCSVTVLALSVAAVLCQPATFPGDVVQFWNTKIAFAIGASDPPLTSPHSAYAVAYVHSAILQAAKASEKETLPVQQVAVSIAAHDTLQTLFLAQYQTFDLALKSVKDAVNLSPEQLSIAHRVGAMEAIAWTASRLGDGVNTFIRYDYQPAAVGVYQATPPSFQVEPNAPSAPFIKPFGNVGDIQAWPVQPPDPKQPVYTTYLQEVMQKGLRSGGTRTAVETETAFLFLENPIMFMSRFVSSVIGDRLQSSVSESAKFYAMFGHALANAGIVGFATKYKYNTWRPVTAIRFNETYLAGGQRLFDTYWTPMAATPPHPEYLAAHAIYASAVGGILKRYLGSDTLNPPVTIMSNASLSSNDNMGLLSRSYSSIDKLVRDVGDSRVFAGHHFRFSCDEGIKAGTFVAQKVFDGFNRT